MIHPAPVSTRNRLATLVESVTGSIVEVGTHRAEYMEILLGSWPGRVYGIDHWDVPAGYEDQAKHLAVLGGTGDREEDYRQAQSRVEVYRQRAALIRKTSASATRLFPSHSLDLVYLDGDHLRPAIDQDLNAWWPKLRGGGLLAGHDFLCPGEADGGWGRHIQPAVMEFAAKNHLDVYVIVEEDNLPWSFYLVKPLE